MMQSKILTAAILVVTFGYPAIYLVAESRQSDKPPPVETQAGVALTPDPVKENEAFEAEIGQLITLTFPMKSVAWTVEPEIVDIAVVSDDTCVLSFRRSGRYVVIAAGHEDKKVKIQRTVIEVKK